jgi:hypothetical protein
MKMTHPAGAVLTGGPLSPGGDPGQNNEGSVNQVGFPVSWWRVLVRSRGRRFDNHANCPSRSDPAVQRIPGLQCLVFGRLPEHLNGNSRRRAQPGVPEGPSGLSVLASLRGSDPGAGRYGQAACQEEHQYPDRQSREVMNRCVVDYANKTTSSGADEGRRTSRSAASAVISVRVAASHIRRCLDGERPVARDLEWTRLSLAVPAVADSTPGTVRTTGNRMASRKSEDAGVGRAPGA